MQARAEKARTGTGLYIMRFNPDGSMSLVVALKSAGKPGCSTRSVLRPQPGCMEMCATLLQDANSQSPSRCIVRFENGLQSYSQIVLVPLNTKSTLTLNGDNFDHVFAGLVINADLA